MLALASLALLSILYKTNLLAGHSDINFKDHSHITKLSLSCVHLPHFKVGDAGLVQRSPLKPNGRDSRYKDPPLPVRSTHSKSDSNSISQDSSELPEELRLSSILSSYSARNLTLRLENDYKVNS